MSKVFFKELNIPKPDYNLDIGSGNHGYQTGLMLQRLEPIVVDERPDIVVVFGDTNTTLAGALIASKLHIPIVHVEAGLRSFNKKMPEEINRVLTDHVSDFLFCPTKTAIQNLKKENITKGVYFTGDIMYDAVLYNLKLAERKSDIIEKLHLKPKEYFLATIHRAENTDDIAKLKTIFLIFNKLSCTVIVPIHPRAKKILEKENIKILSNVRIITPVSYLEMLILEKNSRLILTDSGGVQKEAYFFCVPCITLRNETEWIETVQSGWNILSKVNDKQILVSIEKQLQISKSKNNLKKFYGDGKSALKMAEIITNNNIK
jgi:UDP-N-acetylglucosamine 2-epimerase